VGIGVALEPGEFRMTEEFTRHAAVWVEAPSGRVRAGLSVNVNVQLPKGWSLAAVEIAYERFPRPLSVAEIGRRRSYGFPPASQTLRARLGAGFHYADGSSGDVIADGGLVRAKVALLSGPGSYWVLVFADAGLAEGKTLVPLTAVRITAD
jgi:hypothetical protein